MKRITTLVLLLVAVISLKAQTLETRIPKNADVVVSANTGNLFELLSVNELDSSLMGKSILKNLNRRREDKIPSLEKAGINIKANAYFFLKENNNTIFFNGLFELNDKEKFESHLGKRNLKKLKTNNGFSYLEERENIIIWNERFFLFTLKKNSGKNQDNKGSVEGLKDYAFNLLEGKSDATLASNRSFQKAKKKNSVLTMWVRDYGSLMSKFLGAINETMGSGFSALTSGLTIANNKNMYGIEEVAGNLFFEKDNINLTVDMTVSSGVKKSFKKMYNRKMSSNILKNFDHNKMLGFASFSMNTEEVLLQYPTLINDLYGDFLPNMKEEISLITDLFSLVLDEEAIGELITGNGLFVLNDFSKQKVKFVKYEYDEDYNRKEVESYKDEMVPDFTIMIGSKKEKLLSKILDLGVKHGLLTSNKGLYEFKDKKSELPFKLHIVVKDNVMSFTTSKTRALGILSSRMDYGTSKFNKLIKKSSFLTYVNIHGVMGKVPEGMLGRRMQKTFDFGYENLKDGYLNVSKMKGDKISTQLRINTSTTEENTLKLLFKFINAM
ncbi:hypothetical protein [uncultured Tenacibaculum sp.]|uniref:hypothetical protein n=1 Tax=uncultured Tenacibaculum sp. TaxID=174713 RepID=UPI00261B6C6B|nr:hypothetical protein [uncultured Tenacibaculum sp.]